MDLVVNHCSDERGGLKRLWKILMEAEKYGKYFYIEEGKDSGKEANNWRSYFGGGSAWGNPRYKQYYLHLFHKKTLTPPLGNKKSS